MGLAYEIDGIGNVYVKLGEGRPITLIAAHMDEVGFLVRHVTNRGFLKVAALGGINPSTAIGMEVAVMGEKGDVPGIIGSIPPHLLRGERPIGDHKPTIEDLFIDVGATSKDEACNMGIGPGAPVTFRGEFRDLGSAVMGKAMDDRLGCYALLKALEKAASPARGAVYLVFTVQEEVGTRGASVVAHRIRPDYGIAVEGTIASDVPGVPEENWVTRLGGGAAIRVMDRTMISSSYLLAHLKRLARDNSIPFQLQISPYSGSDAGRFAILGAATTGIAVPVRYIHSPHSMALKSDIDAVVRLLKMAIENPPP